MPRIAARRMKNWRVSVRNLTHRSSTSEAVTAAPTTMSAIWAYRDAELRPEVSRELGTLSTGSPAGASQMLTGAPPAGASGMALAPPEDSGASGMPVVLTRAEQGPEAG